MAQGRLRLHVSCLAVLVALVVGCGGGGSEDRGGGAGEPIDIDGEGRVVLGALGGANVDVYRVGDYSAPVVTATTSTGATLAEIGLFSFRLNAVAQDAVFLFVVTGGSAFDADEDGTIDGAPTPNAGTVHGLASAAQLQAGAILLSLITEIVYQRVRLFMSALYEPAHVFLAAAAWTSFLLRGSIAGGPQIDNDDALAFDPLLHAGALFRPYAPFRLLVAALLAGLPTTQASFALSREEFTYQDLTSGTRGIEVVGDRAYVCHSGEGLDIYDVSNLLSPQLLGTYDTPGSAFAVQVMGNLAYVADSDGGLQIVDVSNPALPTLAGSVPTLGPVRDVEVVGNLAYLANDDFTTPYLHIVDVTTPATASIIADFETADRARGVAVLGNHAYVVQTSEIETIDVGNPALPSSEGTVNTDSFGYIDIAQGHLFHVGGSRLEVFDLSAPASPQSIAELTLPGSNSNGVRAIGSEVYVSRSFDGLQVVDAQDPTAPSLIGTVPTSGSVNRVDREGNVFVITEVNGGLITAAAGTPIPSGVVSSLPLSNMVNAVNAEGNLAYVALNSPRELKILDISDPLAPVELGSAPLVAGQGKAIVVRGDFAFVAESGLQVFDVGNPAAPAHLGGDATVTNLNGLAIDTNVIYGTGSSAGLVPYDITTPGSPVAQPEVASGGTARGVGYDGSAVVVAAGFIGIATYDATVPTAPTKEGTFDTQQALELALKPPFAFVSDVTGNGIGEGLHVIDYSTLTAPNSIHFVELPGTAEIVSLAGDLVYVSADTFGVNVVDASSPASAFHIGTIPVPARVESMDVEGGFLYVGGGLDSGELLVLRAAQVSVP